MRQAARKCLLFGLAVVGSSLVAERAVAVQPNVWASQPDIAAVDRLEHERLAAAERSVAALISVRGKRTVENTLVLFDDAIERVDSASYLAELIQQVHPDKAFRDRATALLTEVTAAQTAIDLNPSVYRALAAVDLSHADAATRYYVSRQLLKSRLAGVAQDETVRERLKKLNEAVSEKQSMFNRNITDDQRSIEADPSELEGLPQDYVGGHPPAANGKVRITTDYPDALPVFRFAKSESLRQRMLTAFDNRGYPKNRDVLTAMLQSRYEIATLLGYRSWADYNAADKMIGSGENIRNFIEDIDRSARPLEEREFRMLLTEKRKTDPQASELTDADYRYLSELVRAAQFDFDAGAVRAYFPFEQVKQGILDTAAALFRVSFERELGTSAWDPAVESWLVLEPSQVIGRLYLDLHPRVGKYTHARTLRILDGIRGKQVPEGALVCNFPAPTAAAPGLMDYDDVIVFFHEFGHLMHHILGGQQRWAGISGINFIGMQRDFVEAPSQMLEEWMHSPQVLAKFARHYQSGAPMPVELIVRMNRAAAFGRAMLVARRNRDSAISYHLHVDKPANIDFDAATLADELRYTLFKPLADTHPWASFTHLAIYSSAYYTYLWDEVIAQDFFGQFDPSNLLGGDAPERYRNTVLVPGSSMSANALVKRFLGRPQDRRAFERWLNEEVAGPDASAQREPRFGPAVR